MIEANQCCLSVRSGSVIDVHVGVSKWAASCRLQLARLQVATVSPRPPRSSRRPPTQHQPQQCWLQTLAQCVRFRIQSPPTVSHITSIVPNSTTRIWATSHSLKLPDFPRQCRRIPAVLAGVSPVQPCQRRIPSIKQLDIRITIAL